MTAGRKEELTIRRARILAAIVEQYVATAAPVGSKAVREGHGVDASTATIRNEMCVLEREGYVHQPHTSAGRVPRDKGYRTYVDEIMPPRAPRVEELAWVRGEYRRAARDPEQLYRTTCRVLSQLTTAPAMVMAPPDEQVVLAEFSLAPASSTIVRLAYRTEPGGAHECLLQSPDPLTARQVEAISRAISERYCGRDVGAFSLCSPDTLADEVAPHSVPSGLLEEIKSAVERDRLQRVYVDGAAYALNYPEYEQLEHLRPVMEALDEEMIVRRLLRPATRRGQLTVIIGREQDMKDLRRCSLIARYYRGAADDVGALGVIGPTRMDYQAITAAVHCVAEHIAEALSDDREGEGNQSQ